MTVPCEKPPRIVRSHGTPVSCGMSRCQELVGGAEGVGVGVADARHHVPVATARRQEERPAGRDAHEPALGVEEVEEGGEVVLVGPAPVHEHERALRLARRRADLVDELGHAVVPARGLVSGVSACSSSSRRASYCGGSLSASPRVSSGSSYSKPMSRLASSKRTPLGSRK